MRISAKTIQRLTDIITGNTEQSPYRSGPELIEFFRDFGEPDLYGQGFPSRAHYVQEKLRKFNGTETLEQIVSVAFDFIGDNAFNPEEQAEAFNRLLVRDGYRLMIEYRSGSMHGDRYVEVDPYFTALRALASPPCQRSRRSGQRRSSATAPDRRRWRPLVHVSEHSVLEKQSDIGISRPRKIPVFFPLQRYSAAPATEHLVPEPRTGILTCVQAWLLLLSERLLWVRYVPLPSVGAEAHVPFKSGSYRLSSSLQCCFRNRNNEASGVFSRCCQRGKY